MYKILLLEDDFKVSNEIKIYLESKDLGCDIVYDGALFFKHLQLENYDLYILDGSRRSIYLFRARIRG
jgi:DNA-binding response OmpR family regulator